MSLKEILEVYEKYDLSSDETDEYFLKSPKTSFHTELIKADYEQDNCLVFK